MHVLDFALFLLGNPAVKSVSASTYDLLGTNGFGGSPQSSKSGAGGDGKFDVEDLATVFMRLEDGGTLLLEASWAMHRADGDQFGATLYGTEGGAEWYVDDYVPVGSLKLFGDRDGFATAQSFRADIGGAHPEVVADFVATIRSGDWAAHDGSAAAQFARVVDAAYRSAREEREIVVVRFVVLGAGAIGGVIGGGLHRAGHDVTLLARGASADVLRSSGLTLQTPDADEVLRVPVGTVEDVRDGDVVILAVKSQDTVAALDSLAGRDVTIVCAQNGVANEVEALRRFERVYGVFVWLPCQHLDPGVVQVYSSPVHGVLAVGRFPAGEDETARDLARAFTEAGCDGVVSDDVMRLKRGKLLGNLINGIQVVLGDGEDAEALHERAMAEARACFEAAGIDIRARHPRARRADVATAPGPRRGPRDVLDVAEPAARLHPRDRLPQRRDRPTRPPTRRPDAGQRRHPGPSPQPKAHLRGLALYLVVMLASPRCSVVST